MSMIENAGQAILTELMKQAEEYNLGVPYVASEDGLSEVVIDGRFDLRDVARAVLLTMREPTDAMQIAGYGNTKGDPDHTGIVDNPEPEDAWRAMIDAALEEGDQNPS